VTKRPVTPDGVELLWLFARECSEGETELLRALREANAHVKELKVQADDREKCARAHRQLELALKHIKHNCLAMDANNLRDFIDQALKGDFEVRSAPLTPKETALKDLLQKLLNKVNRVTCEHRHQDGDYYPPSIVVLDELSNRQIEVEEALAALR